MKAKKEGMKKGGVFVVLPVLLLFFVAMATAPVASAGWDYCRTITIDNTKVSGSSALTDFPVLINLSYDDWLKDSGHGGHVNQSDGGDIVFTNEANTIKLDHEIEEYDGTNGKLIAWVKIPSLSASSPDTAIWMYYGNADCAKQWNPTGVWDDNYKMVQHLDETSGTVYDSTLNDNDGTAHNGVIQGATGKINGADEFEGTDEYVDCGAGSSLDITTELTMESWVKLEHPSDDQKIVGKANVWGAGPPYAGYGYVMGVGDSKLYPEIWDTAKNHYTFSSGTITANEWTHLAVTWKTGGNMIGYINGVSVNTTSASSNNIGTTTRSLTIGCAPWNHLQWLVVNGIIDEVRILATARSADWILTEYNNQKYPDDHVYPGNGFYTVSGTEHGPCYPVPEFSTLVLLSIGLLALSGYVVLRKRF